MMEIMIFPTQNDMMMSSTSTTSYNNIKAQYLYFRKKKKVTFDTIEIREYSRCLGDHPSTSFGPPLTIDWDYTCKLNMDLYEYERQKIQQHLLLTATQTKPSSWSLLDGDQNNSSNDTRRRRRRTTPSYLSPETRTTILLEQSGTTRQQIRNTICQIKHIQRQRKMSIAMSEFDGWNLFLESVSRKVKRICRGVSKKQEQQLLWDNAQQIMMMIENKKDGHSHEEEEEDADTCAISDSFRSDDDDMAL